MPTAGLSETCVPSSEPLGSSFDGQQSRVDTHLNSLKPGGIQVPARTVKPSARVFNKKKV